MLILPSQEDFADFNQSESRTQEGFGDFDQDYSEDPGPTQACGEEGGGLGAYGDQRGLSEGETWAEFGEEDRARRTEEAEEKKGGESFQRVLLYEGTVCRPPCLSGYRRVLQTSFPAWQSQNWIRRGRRLGWRGRRLVERRRLWRRRRRRGWRGQWVEVLNVLSLRALLETLDTQPEEEETKGLNHTTHWVPRGAWRQPQDLHDAVGLGFQWGGSHSNRALLRCLGMDTRNMLFTGQRKQPVIVPVFAASLGMLEAHQRATESSFSCGEDCCTQALPGSQETTTTSSIKGTETGVGRSCPRC
ncbi:aftiphilin [Salvelinus sp. IW2-2015]|uniref:aftiphilin n=1 Tax=Salvelinus sp. IW2-2015 TaxID=2691554 RepID=UPI0038D4FBE0